MYIPWIAMSIKPPSPFSAAKQVRATPVLVLLLIGLLWLTAACSSPVVHDAPTSTPQDKATQTATLPAPATQTPTATTGTIYLVVGPDAHPTIAAELQPLLQEIAGDQGLRFQIRQEISPLELQFAPLVVVVAPHPDLPELMSASPQTHFLAIGFS